MAYTPRRPEKVKLRDVLATLIFAAIFFAFQWGFKLVIEDLSRTNP